MLMPIKVIRTDINDHQVTGPDINAHQVTGPDANAHQSNMTGC